MNVFRQDKFWHLNSKDNATRIMLLSFMVFLSTTSSQKHSSLVVVFLSLTGLCINFLTRLWFSSRSLGDNVSLVNVFVHNYCLNLLQTATASLNLALPRHNRCAAHTLNLIATADASKALSCTSFKKSFRSAFAKAQGLWNRVIRL